MYSLLIDTHDEDVICVIYKDKKTLIIKYLKSNMRHSEITMPTLIEVIKEAGINVEDINDIVVNIGPGSFTGVRIGVVIAKSIAYLLNKPIRGINSLEMLVFSLDDITAGYYKISEKNGYFVGKFDNSGNLVDEIKYYSLEEYEKEFNEDDFINVDKIDFDNIYKNIVKREPTNPHLINPIYIKQIEALKWFL